MKNSVLAAITRRFVSGATRENTSAVADDESELGAAVLEAAAQTNHRLRLARTMQEAFRIMSRAAADVDFVIVNLDHSLHSLVVTEALASCYDSPRVIALTQPNQLGATSVARYGAIVCIARPLTVEKLAAAMHLFSVAAPAGAQCSCDRWGHPCTHSFLRDSLGRTRPRRLSDARRAETSCC